MGFSFEHLPANPLIGANYQTFNRTTSGKSIDNRAKYIVTKSCQRLLSPLYEINNREYLSIPKPEIISPLFIIGHWRSGTTLVHNTLSRDPQFGYCTTYQTVFPNLMFYGSRLFKRLAALCMPASRPSDNLSLSINQPQEEEFAISNLTHAAYYHFWIFPKQMAELRERYLLFNDATPEDIALFSDAVKRTIHTALHCSGKRRFLSKNPPHTARIPILLSMFPDAKFIYIHRNKRDVIDSTRRFFRSTIDSIALQRISTAELNYQIERTYHALLSRYHNDKRLIPRGNLCQIEFEDFVTNPHDSTEYIYQTLSL